MADFLVSDFLDLLYEDLRKDFISPLQVGKERWESYKAGRLSEIRQLLRIDLLENKYEEALDYTLLESHKEDGITIEKYKVERIKNCLSAFMCSVLIQETERLYYISTGMIREGQREYSGQKAG